MKKILVGFSLALFCITTAFATTPYDEIMNESKVNSPSVKNAELTYLNNKLSQGQKDSSGNVSVELGTGNMSLLPTDNTLANDLSANPYVTIILPNDGNTTFKANVNMGFKYKDGTIDASNSINPSISASHTFDLSKDVTTISDINDTIAHLNTEMSYQNSIISFENTVITSISSILSAEQQVEKTKRSIAKAEENLQNQLTLGKISQDSLAYQKSSIDIDKSKQSLDAMEKQTQNAIDNFKVLTGITWEGIDSLPTPDLTFNPLSSGNTTVYLRQLAGEIAAENLQNALKVNNTQTLGINGGASGTNILTDSEKYSINGGVTYSLNTTTQTKNNIKVNSTFGADYSISDNKFNPSLTLSASWKNNASLENTVTEIQMLQNKLQQAQNDYQNAYTSYTQSVQNMYIDIFNYEYKVSSNDINNDYLQSTLDYQKELYDAGLVSLTSVEDATFNLEMSKYDEKILILEGLKLQNSIKQLML